MQHFPDYLMNHARFRPSSMLCFSSVWRASSLIIAFCEYRFRVVDQRLTIRVRENVRLILTCLACVLIHKTFGSISNVQIAFNRDLRLQPKGVISSLSKVGCNTNTDHLPCYLLLSSNTCYPPLPLPASCYPWLQAASWKFKILSPYESRIREADLKKKQNKVDIWRRIE